MSAVETLAQKYRALRCNHIANHLPEVLAQAEANELSYLELADRLIDLEIEGRTKNSVAMNLKKAYPVSTILAGQRQLSWPVGCRFALGLISPVL